MAVVTSQLTSPMGTIAPRPAIIEKTISTEDTSSSLLESYTGFINSVPPIERDHIGTGRIARLTPEDQPKVYFLTEGNYFTSLELQIETGFWVIIGCDDNRKPVREFARLSKDATNVEIRVQLKEAIRQNKNGPFKTVGE